MHTNYRKWSAAFLCLAMIQARLNAAIIYETFGPDPIGPTFTPGWSYSNQGIGSGREDASLFSFPGSAYRLDSVTLHMGGGEASPNLSIRIYGDNAGTPSLTPVAQLNPNPTLLGGPRQFLTYQFSNPVFLQPDTPYWLGLGPNIVATNQAGNAFYSISSTPAGAPGTTGWRNFSTSDLDGGDWIIAPNSPDTRHPFFRLDGTAVPEPGMWALLGMGCALGWCALRRRSK